MGERRVRLLGAVVVSLVLATLSVPQATTAGHAASSTLAGDRPAVGTDGRWLVDGQGRTIYVHGLQIAHKTAPYHPPAGGLTRADARVIKQLGINAVRLAWFWKGLEPERDQIDGAYLDEILREVDLLTSQGIWVLLEFHQDNYNESVHGAGFPDWATFTDGMPNPAADTAGGAYLNNPAMQRAFDNLYTDRDGIRSEMAEAWRTVAGAVVSSGADNERLLGYDLFNESWPGTAYPTCTPPLGCPLFDTTVLQPLQDELALAVRSVDQKTPVFYEPHLLADFGSPSHLSAPPPGVGPVAFGFHDYCFSSLVTKEPDGESDSAGYPACSALDEQVYEEAERTASRMDAAIVQTEFGDTQDLAELERVMRLADSHLTGWMLWGYKDWIDYPGGIGDGDMFDDPDDLSTLRQPMADVVSRPVPQLVSGTPTRYSYDATSGRMELEWTPRPGVDAATVIFVPVARHYPDGYRVTVEGGKVISPADATQLRVLNTGGPVSLQLVPRGRAG